MTPSRGRGSSRAMKGPEEQGTFLVAERKARIDEVVAERTRTLTVVMEAFCDPQNVNAVLRTCEAFGVQELHVVEGPQKRFDRNKKISPERRQVARRPPLASTAECLGHLRAQGFSIYVTHLGEGTRRARRPLLRGEGRPRLRQRAAAASRTRRCGSPTRPSRSRCAASSSPSTCRSRRRSRSRGRSSGARSSAGGTATCRRSEAAALRERFYVLAVKQRTRIAKAAEVEGRRVRRGTRR